MKKIVVGTMAAILFLSSSAFGQDLRDRRIEEERRKEFEQFRKATKELDEGFSYDYGGWWKSSIYLADDSDNIRRTTRDQDIRAYLDLSYKRIHQLYARARLGFRDNNSGDAPDGDDDDTIGVNMDQLYYNLDLAGLFGDDFPFYRADLRVGRQFFIMGDGFAFNTINDGILLDLRHSLFDLKLHASKSIRSNADFDSSRPKSEDSKRNFYGGELSLNVLDKHRPFVYGLFERDRNNGDELDPNQEYDYDADYLGIGMEGEVILRGLRYHIEYVRQRGDSPAAGSLERENIRAYGFEAKVEYILDMPWEPKINAAYLTGSGDRDSRSITASNIGNQPGTSDKNFVDFGYVDTGFSFAPRVANLHIYNLGASVRPFSNLEGEFDFLKEMEIGTNWYLYRKDIGDTVISDPTATLQDKDAGWEMDFFLNWRIFSDLTLSAQYGRFFPGDAYPDKDQRDFFSLAVTLSF